MFTFTMDKVELNRLNRRPGLPKPGRQHGSGGRIRGKAGDKWMDSRPSVQKNNPGIRGQTNMVSGRFIEPHDSDDAPVAKMANRFHSTGKTTGGMPIYGKSYSIRRN